MNVLVSLYKGYGLGDGAQMSAVLRHLAKHRPGWIIDYQAEEGRHQVGRGIVANHFAYNTPYPHSHYDFEVQICLYDTWANFGDRPNTRVSSCLHERFGMGWDAECGRYQVEVRKQSTDSARTLLYGWSGRANYKRRGERLEGHYKRNNTRCVAIHYQGDSSQERKNLTHEQADEICRTVERFGCVPVILDWRNRSPLPYRRITSPEIWGADAEMVCAVISECDAFVGIDSGPSKCASATDTPALVIWTGHHPAPFHDPAPNTTHLVPRGYHGLEPVCNDRGVIDWFEQHYNTRQYNYDLVRDVGVWLKEVLK